MSHRESNPAGDTLVNLAYRVLFFRRQRAYNPDVTPYKVVPDSLAVGPELAQFEILNTKNNIGECLYFPSQMVQIDCLANS